MLRKLLLTLATIAGLATPGYSAGLVPLSLQTVFDNTGSPAAGCRLQTYEAGTTTPQTVYQDSGLSIAWPNPTTCDQVGRLPQMFAADGNIKLRLTTSAGVELLAVDSVLVIGPSSGGGGGGSVDATTILATGDLKPRYGTGVLSGFVRLNGRTIGSATSGATERANADTQALFEYLWDADTNLSVSGGRGANAAADWAANKALTLPDARGRIIANLDDLGTTAASRLTSTFITGPTTLGAAGGTQSSVLAQTNLPAVAPTGSVSVTGGSHSHTIDGDFSGVQSGTGATALIASGNRSSGLTTPSMSATFTGNALGSATAFGNLPPMMLVTTYIKLKVRPDRQNNPVRDRSRTAGRPRRSSRHARRSLRRAA